MVVDQQPQQDARGVCGQAPLQDNEHILQQRALMVGVVLQHL